MRNKYKTHNYINEFIEYVVNNLFPLNEYSSGEMKYLMDKFKEEADDLNIEVSDAQLQKYIERFDALENSPKVEEKDLRKYSLSKLIKLVTTSKGVEVPDEVDTTPDVVYNENGLIIYNGSKEENCLKFGSGESWCITRGSFGNYRYNDSRKNPTFYLVKDTNKPDSDRASFFVVVVGNDNTYKVSDRSNNDVGGRQTEWERWENWDFVERHFPSVRGLRSVFKYIPLSSSEKLNNKYKETPTSIRDWLKLPYQTKEQYLVLRQGKDLFSDISNNEFIEKYLPKQQPIANFISTNQGIIQPELLAKHLESFSNQQVKSIIANMRNPVSIDILSSDTTPFAVKKYLLKNNKIKLNSNQKSYVTEDGNTIVLLTIGDEIKMGLYQAEDDFPNVKLNKRTSKFLLDYPDLEQIPLSQLLKLASQDIIGKEVIEKLINKIKSDPESNIVIQKKDNIEYIIDTDSLEAFKIEGNNISSEDFNSDEVQNILNDLNGGSEDRQEKTKEFIQNNVLEDNHIPERFSKEATLRTIKSLPLNKRIIDFKPRYNTSYQRSIIIPIGGQESYMMIIPATSTLAGNGLLWILGSYDTNNWRNKLSARNIYNAEQVQALVEYLRESNTNVTQEQLLSTMRSSASLRMKREFINANPPIDPNSNLKPVIFNDNLYLVNTQNPRNSFIISNRTGRLLSKVLTSRNVSQILGTQVGGEQGAEPQVRRRGRPAGTTRNATAVQTQPQAQQAGTTDVASAMARVGLENGFSNIPRADLRRLNINNARIVPVRNNRGASRRQNALGNSGRVTAVIEAGRSDIYIIQLTNGQTIASVRTQPNNNHYIITSNQAIPLGSPTELMSALRARNLAEIKKFIVNEYINGDTNRLNELKNLKNQ
jgi:hypothetical protein